MSVSGAVIGIPVITTEILQPIIQQGLHREIFALHVVQAGKVLREHYAVHLAIASVQEAADMT